jgi:hypothetical protein
MYKIKFINAPLNVLQPCTSVETSYVNSVMPDVQPVQDLSQLNAVPVLVDFSLKILQCVLHLQSAILVDMQTQVLINVEIVKALVKHV